MLCIKSIKKKLRACTVSDTLIIRMYVLVQNLLSFSLRVYNMHMIWLCSEYCIADYFWGVLIFVIFITSLGVTKLFSTCTMNCIYDCLGRTLFCYHTQCPRSTGSSSKLSCVCWLKDHLVLSCSVPLTVLTSPFDCPRKYFWPSSQAKIPIEIVI